MSERRPPSPLNPTFALALIAALGCLLLAFANLNQERVVEWIVSDPENTAFRLRALLALLGVIGVLPVAFVAVFSARLSLRISSSGRYPPPGVEIRRVRVREGSDAEAIARRLRIGSIVLGCIALSIPLLFWWLAVTLTPG